ncbi:large ribosomal subunit protein mL46-like [Crassostrea virginica]
MSSVGTRRFISEIPRAIKHRAACLHRARQNRNYSQSSENTSAIERDIETPGKWTVTGALYLERLPIITPPLSKLEQEYREYKLQQETEQSLLSDFEISKKEEEERLANQKKNVLDTPIHLRNVPVQTFQDKEEIWDKELSQFTPADRETEADRNNDMKSVSRKLDQPLVLLLKKIVNGKDFWYLPYLDYIPRHSMRQVAEKALTDSCGTNLQFQTFSNAPSGYQVLHYGNDMIKKTQSNGSKVFIYKAEYRGGIVNPDKDKHILDYAWVTRRELRQFVGRSTSRLFNKFTFF